MQIVDMGKDHGLEPVPSIEGHSSHAEATPPQNQPPDTIVIIGAGSVGLCTAYNLAKGSHNSSSPVKIIVVELFDQPFATNSLTCAGCLHYGFPEHETQPLLPLGKYSFDLWEAQADEEEFRIKSGYRANSSFGVNLGCGQGIDMLPDWIQTELTWNIDEKVLGCRNATVNPAGIGKWLAAKCLSLGVEIRTGLKVVDASLFSHNKVQAVTCLDNGGSPIRIDCSRLLGACGPWTPVTYKKLFPSSSIQLQSSVNAGDWLVCKNPCPTSFESTPLVSLANIVGEKLEFAGRNDGTIWCCGKRNFTASLPAPDEMDEPDEAAIEMLCGYARRWLNMSCECTSKHVDELEIVGTGRAFRPSTKSGLPIISQVKPWDSTSVSTNTDQIRDASGGVFVSWGHGWYGLTFGLGTGKLMSQLMCGQEPDLDLSLFDLTLNANEVQDSTTVSGRYENL